MKKSLPFELAESTPFYKHVGIKVVEAKDGFARLEVEFEHHLTHPFGYFHGGVIASLADSAGHNHA